MRAIGRELLFTAIEHAITILELPRGTLNMREVAKPIPVLTPVKTTKATLRRCRSVAILQILRLDTHGIRMRFENFLTLRVGAILLIMSAGVNRLAFRMFRFWQALISERTAVFKGVRMQTFCSVLSRRPIRAIVYPDITTKATCRTAAGLRPNQGCVTYAHHDELTKSRRLQSKQDCWEDAQRWRRGSVHLLWLWW